MISKSNKPDFLSINDIEQYYIENIAKYGLEAPRTMGYHTGPIDDRLISKILPHSLSKEYSVLDVGCGLGQLIPILQTKFPESQMMQFVGLDLVADFISSCRERLQPHEFHKVDFLEWELTQRFDLVIAAGVLVTRIADFESYLHQFIEKMVLASKSWVGFNVIGSLSPSYTAKHLTAIPEEKLWAILGNFPKLDWDVNSIEVFPGSRDIFVGGRIKER